MERRNSKERIRLYDHNRKIRRASKIMPVPEPINIPALTTCDNIPSFRLVADQLSRVRSLIYEQLTAHSSSITGLGSFPNKRRPEAVNHLLEYISSRSGKMIRPGLVLLAGLSSGKITDEHIRVAAILEMMHNATLLHDDVIDEGRIRRGVPTINNLWGNETAVLLGDLLLSRIFTMSAELESSTAKIVAEAAVRLCEGELKQAVQKNKWQLSESDYIEAITEKSAVLFSSACYLGGFLANGSQSRAHSRRAAWPAAGRTLAPERGTYQPGRPHLPHYDQPPGGRRCSAPGAPAGQNRAAHACGSAPLPGAAACRHQ